MRKGEESNSLQQPLVALFLFVFLAVYATWPVAFSSQPHDHADTFFNTWLISWNGHALLNAQNPLHLPIFSGFRDGNGRNDFLLAQTIFSLPLQLSGLNPVLIHNLLLVASLAFAGAAAAFLARETGTGFTGSVFCGAVVVLLPYFQSHLWHLQLFSVGFSFVATAYAIGTIDGKSKGWQLALLVFLQAMASLYFWYFLNLLLVLFALFVFFSPDKKRLPRLLAWWAAGNVVTFPFLIEHIKNAGKWSIDSVASTDIAAFFAPWSNSFILGWMRADSVHPEAALWPGAAVLIGALWFLFSIRRNRWDLFLFSCVVFFALFSLGPTLVVLGKAVSPAPFRFLAHLPGCSSIRLPARAGIFAIVPLAIFAGRAFDNRPFLAVTGVLITMFATMHPPVDLIPTEKSPWHDWLAEADFNRVLYLPIAFDPDRPESETERLFDSIGHFTPSVNGYSTTLPSRYKTFAELLNTWPSSAADSLLRVLNVDCIIVEGMRVPEADTVFFDGKRYASAVVLH